MNNEQQTRLLILGFIAQLPPSEQQRVQECEAKLMAVLGEYGPIGGLALAKLGAEMAMGQPDAPAFSKEDVFAANLAAMQSFGGGW